MQQAVAWWHFHLSKFPNPNVIKELEDKIEGKWAYP